MPNIFQSYETAERGILKKKPRNVKTDKLCTGRLFIYAYFFNGIIECMGCLLAYFVVMSDYGFRPINLFFFSKQ